MKNEEGHILVSKVPLGKQLHNADISVLKRYQFKVFGNDRFLRFLEYELVTFLFANLSGGLGYFLRKWSYRRFFKKVGRGVIFGKGVVLRHPRCISLGHHVAIDDYAMIDAAGAGNEGIILGDGVIVSRNCAIQAKTGPVMIGSKTHIGCNTIISSATGISIGQTGLIAGNCYIGGGRYISDRVDIPMAEQGLYSKGPVVIEDDVWLGAGAIVIDGVHIGKGCIVGAGAVVTKNLSDYAVATGIPASVVRSRAKNPKSGQEK